MEESLFIEWVNQYFPGITIRVVEKLNDTKNPLTYLHRRLLSKDYSVTGKWEALSASFSLVAADVVAMDSSLPLKKRDSISSANGDIPKMGMEMWLNEKQLSELDVLVAQNATKETLLKKLFADTPKVIGGIYERLEGMFLQGLSTGITLVQDDENVGVGIRLNYGYLAENKFTSDVAWSDPALKPFTDLQPILDKAAVDGNAIIRIFLDRPTFNNVAKSTEARELYASSVDFFGTNIPIPSLIKLNVATQDKYGFVFEIVDRVIKYEKNGVRVSKKPWAAGQVVCVCADTLGSLMYATLAEVNHPVDNVSYNVVDDFILVSKYRMNRPSLSEFTSSQARVAPVIGNVDQIYTLDTTVTTPQNPPVVTAPADKAVTTATTSLAGTAAAQDGKTIVSKLWSQVSGPSSAGIASPAALSTNITGMVTGVYVFRFSATDSDNLTSAADVTVTATVA